MVKVLIFILLGGLIGPDGYAVSPGIIRLAHRLDALGEVTTHNWTAQRDVTERIANLDANDKVVLIGYSGGGFAITQIAEELNGKEPHKIDLLIAYDPSPAWSMKSLGKNVAKAICYCNTSPLMLGLGGAQLRGQSVEIVPISEQHLAVQFDESLHKRTIAEVEKLVTKRDDRSSKH
jgi:pimeloyl-ACP methyl ester carboxylesterase